MASGEPSNEPADFESRFRAHRTDVERLCRRMLGRDAAEDASQEVYLRARRAFGEYDAARPFRPWLLAVAGNLCIDMIRRRAREVRLFEARDFVSEDLVSPGASPLRQVQDAQKRRQIVDALDRLPLKYRIPLVLRHFQDLDYEAIAEILDVSRGQVGTLLFRARRMLREQLGGSR